jgi:hypothetical protein
MVDISFYVGNADFYFKKYLFLGYYFSRWLNAPIRFMFHVILEGQTCISLLGDNHFSFFYPTSLYILFLFWGHTYYSPFRCHFVFQLALLSGRLSPTYATAQCYSPRYI